MTITEQEAVLVGSPQRGPSNGHNGTAPSRVIGVRPVAKSLGVGIIGYGYWGPNLARNFAGIPSTHLAAVADHDSGRLQRAGSEHPAARLTDDHETLLQDPGVDAVVVATPLATHYELALSALQAGKHVLVEKPLAATTEQARRLIDEAQQRSLVLMVDHTFLYSGAVRKIMELARSGVLGQVIYYDSVRINLGLFQADVNVLWDLAAHDLAIIDALMPRPVSVTAHAMSHVPGQPENIGYLTMEFPGSQIAHIHVNWLAPVKVRRTLVGCQDKMLLYDDVEPSEKIKIYDCGANLSHHPEARHKLLVSYRKGDMWAPRIDQTEALRVCAQHFAECILKGGTPVTDAESGLRVIEILEAADRSIEEGGCPVPVGA